MPPTYDLHNLGWSDFQRLCLTITRELLGQTVESFLDSGDGGRDGAFSGHWRPRAGEDLSGPFVLQCKFTSRIGHVLKAHDLTEEFEKAKLLVEKGLCESYVLLTNAGLSGPGAAEIKGRLQDVGVKKAVLFGATWIVQQIQEHKRLRMLVPRLYGLGDLGQILDERAYAQARAVLESMREDLSKVVVTDAYRRAIDAVSTHGFVLLIGEPAAGKTTIASLLALAALDQWHASTLKLDDPEKLATHWNPEEPSQFFWLDDAFGVMQYEDFLVHRWNHALPQVRAMLRRGAKVVMTSRDYIYNRARRDLKESAFPMMSESQVVVDVRDLQPEEKAQILYNHIKLGKQPLAFRRQIKPLLQGVAGHSRFIPETARRLGDPLFTRRLYLGESSLALFVEKREQLLGEVLQGLDNDSRAALALIYMRSGRLGSPVDLETFELAALARLGSSLGGCLLALNSLRGSLVVFNQTEHNWQFKHPTIGDAYASTLADSPENVGILIQGSAPERLIEQVTCGDVGIEKAVIVPTSLFPQIIAKLSTLVASKRYKSRFLAEFGAERDVYGFLSRRCSKEFLSIYVRENPAILDDIAAPGLYLSAVPEVRLARRLFELGILPEPVRRAFAAAVSSYALEGEDGEVLHDERLRVLFTTEELEALDRGLHERLLPRLGDVRRNLQINHPSGQSAEEYMQPFVQILDALKGRFGDDPEALELVESELERVSEWVSENEEQEDDVEPRTLDPISTAMEPQHQRSIFDDVDEDPALGDHWAS